MSVIYLPEDPFTRDLGASLQGAAGNIAAGYTKRKEREFEQNLKKQQSYDLAIALGEPEEEALKYKGVDPSVIPSAVKAKREKSGVKNAAESFIEQLGLESKSPTAKAMREAPSMDVLLKYADFAQKQKAATDKAKTESATEKAKPTEFEKEMQKKLAQEAIAAFDELPKIRAQTQNIARMRELAEGLKGATYAAKALSPFGSQDIKEYEALSLGAIEPILKVFNPRGVIPQRKIEMLKDLFVPKASDSRNTMEGKTKALEAYVKVAEQRILAVMEAAQNGTIFDLAKMDAEGEKQINELLSESQPWEESELTAGERVKEINKIDGVKGEEKAPLEEKIAEKQQKPPLKVRKAPISDKTFDDVKRAPITDETYDDVLRAPISKEDPVKKETPPIKKEPRPGIEEVAEKDSISKEPPEESEDRGYWEVAKDVGNAIRKGNDLVAYGRQQVSLQGARAMTKAPAAILDFANTIADYALGSKLPVEKVTKEVFGEAMDFEQLAEGAFDYATSNEFKPTNPYSRIYQKGVQLGTEFAIPFPVKGGKTAKQFFTGLISGTAFQTSKEAGLGEEAQLAALLLPMFFKPTKESAKAAMKIARDPKLLAEMGKDFIQFMKGRGEAIKEFFTKDGILKAGKAIKERALQDFDKDKVIEKVAKIEAKRLGLKPEQIRESRLEELAAKGRTVGEEALPLSEIFENESVFAQEARILESPKAKEIYKPLTEKMTNEVAEKYSKILAGTAGASPEYTFKAVSDATNKKELKEAFTNALWKENKVADETIGRGFSTLEQYRTNKKFWKKGSDGKTIQKTDVARASIGDTKKLIKHIDAAIESHLKGGSLFKDSEPIKWLRRFRARLLKKSPKEAAKIKSLESEIKTIEKESEEINKRFSSSPGIGLKIEKPHFANKALAKNKAEIATKTKEINVLKDVGAEIEEIEQGYRKINSALNYEKQFQTKDLSRLRLKKELNKTLENYGAKYNPRYYDTFKKLNKQYSDFKSTIKSDVVWNTLHGKRPDAVYALLDTKEGIKQFDLIMASGDLELNALGRMMKASKVNDILYPKLFSEGKTLKEKFLGFSRLTTIQKDKLVNLLGKKGYENLQTLQQEVVANEKRITAYLSTSKSSQSLKEEAKKFMTAHGVWNLITGGFTAKIKGAGSIIAANQNQLLAFLYSDPTFQKKLLNVVREGSSANPSIDAVNQLGTYLSRAWKAGKIGFKKGAEKGTEAALAAKELEKDQS